MNLNQDGINHGGNLASEWDFDGESERKRIETAIKTLKHPIGSFSRKKRVSRENHSYNKMGKKSLDFLNNYFATNKYPNKEGLDFIAKNIGEPMEKITNWFKYKRRVLVQKGNMKFEVFTEKETVFLMEEFMKNKRPNNAKYKEMAEIMGCNPKNIKNWFSYKRKLILKIDKRRRIYEPKNINCGNPEPTQIKGINNEENLANEMKNIKDSVSEILLMSQFLSFCTQIATGTEDHA